MVRYRIYVLPVVALVLTFWCANVADLHAQTLSPRTALIMQFKGTVKIKPLNAGDWADAVVGMALKEGDVIKTEADSNADLAFGEGLKSVIRIFPQSQMVISKLNPGVVKLEQGRVFSLIKLDKGSTFEVRTPTAVAGARGTGWGTIYENNKTEIQDFEQAVYAAGLNENGEIISLQDLQEGWAAFVAKNEGPSGLIRLTDDEMSVWRTWKEEVLKVLEDFRRTQNAGGGEGQGDDENMESMERREKILDRVERETQRTEEAKRERRSESQEGNNNESSPSNTAK